VAVLMALLFGVLTYFIVRRMTAPLEAATDLALRFGEGDLTATIQGKRRIRTRCAASSTRWRTSGRSCGPRSAGWRGGAMTSPRPPRSFPPPRRRSTAPTVRSAARRRASPAPPRR
jgi:HAMP domain-containing protein